MATDNAQDGSERADEGPASEDRSRAESIKGGIRQGMSMLSAMKDAIEETLNEARERGDLTPERAREVMRSTLEKAQSKAGEARDALDFVRQREFDTLRAAVGDLEDRVRSLERSLGLEVEAGSDDAPGGEAHD